MRVVAGLYRSRLLSAPKGWATRPTSDRLRETLFNILAPRVDGCRFVDLYAGTGAVGIEALSRGAAQVWFAEDSPVALRALRSNLSSLGIASGFSIEDRGTGVLVERMAETGANADIIFLDPPYAQEQSYSSTLGLLGDRAHRILSAGAVVVAEHASKTVLAERFGGLTRMRVLKQGDASLSFYTAQEEERLEP